MHNIPTISGRKKSNIVSSIQQNILATNSPLPPFAGYRKQALRTASSFAKNVLLRLLLLLPFTLIVADAQTEVSMFNGATPPSVQAANPSNAYALSDIEQYSPYNGSLSLNIPLKRVGGRGEATFELNVIIKSSFRFRKFRSATGQTSGVDFVHNGYRLAPEPIKIERSASYGLGGSTCPGGDKLQLQNTLVRYEAYWANGTTKVLRDTGLDGEPASVPSNLSCGQSGTTTIDAGRGQTLLARDGSQTAMQMETRILDSVVPGAENIGILTPVSGVLAEADGTRYHIDKGLASWMQDRNGNRITFTRNPNGPFVGTRSQSEKDNSVFPAFTSVIDQLGRETHVGFSETGCSRGTGCEYIRYQTDSQTTRQVELYGAPLSQALRSSYSIKTKSELFPTNRLFLNQASDPFNTTVLQYIVLPDHSFYEFKYNSYAEIASVRLPTGGLIEYDYRGFNGTEEGWFGSVDDNFPIMIYRRLVERRSYDSNYNLVGKTSYSWDKDVDQNLKTTQTLVEPNGQVDSVRTTYFFSNPLDEQSLQPQLEYPRWRWGKTRKVEEGLPVLKTTTYAWELRAAVAWCVSSAYLCQPAEPENDPRMVDVTTTLNDSNQVSKIHYGYDQYNNINEKREYDWGSGRPGVITRSTLYWYLIGPNYENFTQRLVRLPTQIAVYKGQNELAELAYYDYDACCGTSIADALGIVGHDATIDVNYTTRGNVVQKRMWINLPAEQYATASYRYDIAGNVVKQSDALGNTTTYSYADTANSYAHATSITNALNQSTSLAYNFYDGTAASMTDVNNVKTEYAYNDPLSRLTSIRRAVNQTVESETTIDYMSPTWILQKTDQGGGKYLRSDSIFDGFGRSAQQYTYEDPGTYILSTTSYDAAGRVVTRTNPSRPGDNLGAPTNYTYDMLGRQTSMLHPGGATETTAYFGDRATVTDPAGKTKSYNYDALGRLVKVIEHPNEPESTADYGYDALDNLISVKHGRHPNYQHRSFIYDSLSRLVEAKNPESGKVEYAYDAVGNLIRRTDNRLINTTYVYDKLNRLREKKYSDATPQVSYMYDDVDVPNSKGRLTRINNVKSGSNLSTTNMTAYDALGRVIASSQTTNGRDYKFTYTYNLAGALTSETYPSGRKVETSYDAVNRPITVQSSGLPYLTDVKYAPHGAPSQYRYGNNLFRSMTYNNRLQTATMKDTAQEIALWDASLNFGAANNNGNLQSETTVHSVSGPPGNPRYPLTFQATYGYDLLNRLSTVAATGFNIRYGYDAWNNMWVPEPPAFQVNGLTPRDNVYEATNRMRGLTYDPAGNLQSYGTKSIVYDAENKQSTVTESAAAGGGQVTYAFDGDGRRVMKTINADSTVYVYDIFGHLAAEYTNYAVEPPPCTTCYLSVDHLGSTRLVTDAAANVISRHDYLPFGEEIPSGVAGRTSEWGSTTDVRQKFTGKERDKETGLDYFGARYMSSVQGRFMSPDPLGGSLTNPQSLNRYAYALNNPLTFTDPTGMYVCKDGQDGACTSDQDKAFEKSLDKLRGSKNADIARAAAAYGTAGNNNGVTVGFADLTKKGEDGNVVSTLGSDANGNIFAQSDVTINLKATGAAFNAAIGHEGSHVADAQDVVKSGISVDANGNVVAGTNISRYQSERRAYGVSNAILSSEGVTVNVTCGASSFCNMGQGTMQGQVPGIVDRILGYAPNGYSSGGKPMSRTNQGGSVVNGLTMNPNTTVPR